MANQDLITAALNAIKEAREKGNNVLTADISLAGLSEWHVPVVEVVTLDSVVAGKEGYPVNGDIYLQSKNDEEKKRRYAVSRQGLSKLAVAAGVIWSANETRRTDNRQCRDYVSFQAVGGIQKPDGTYTFMKAEYDLDMEVVEEEMVGQKKKDWEIKKEMIQKRKNKLKLCESGAKDRVIRELLGIRATYPLEQISKPFVILRITVRPDYNDPKVKNAMIAAAIGSMTGIYGGSMPAQIPYEEPIDVTDISREEEPEPPAPEAPFDNPFAEPEKPPFIDDETDFKNCSREEQNETIRAMLKRKGRREGDLIKPVDKMSRTEIEGTFRYLKLLDDMKGAA